MAFGTLALTVVWTPLLLRDNGIAPAQASIVIGVHFLGALIGMASAGRLMERFGAVPILCPALFLGALVTATLGYAATSMTSMSAALFLIGLFVGMGASGAIALAALTYPTAIRSSGIGWAMGMGRFGQVLAPLLASAFIAASWSNIQLFFAVGLAPALGCARHSGAALERRDRAPTPGDCGPSIGNLNESRSLLWRGTSSPSPRLRGEGRGEGDSQSAQTRGNARSPGSLRDPTSPRKRGEITPARRSAFSTPCAIALPRNAVSSSKQEGRAAMMRSTDRIITTHAGSLPRPERLWRAWASPATGPAHEKELDALLRSSVADVVRGQLDAGVDVPNDGEFGKPMRSASDLAAWGVYIFDD